MDDIIASVSASKKDKKKGGEGEAEEQEEEEEEETSPTAVVGVFADAENKADRAVFDRLAFADESRLYYRASLASGFFAELSKRFPALVKKDEAPLLLLFRAFDKSPAVCAKSAPCATGGEDSLKKFLVGGGETSFLRVLSD